MYMFMYYHAKSNLPATSCSQIQGSTSPGVWDAQTSNKLLLQGKRGGGTKGGCYIKTVIAMQTFCLTFLLLTFDHWQCTPLCFLPPWTQQPSFDLLYEGCQVLWIALHDLIELGKLSWSEEHFGQPKLEVCIIKSQRFEQSLKKKKVNFHYTCKFPNDNGEQRCIQLQIKHMLLLSSIVKLLNSCRGAYFFLHDIIHPLNAVTWPTLQKSLGSNLANSAGIYFLYMPYRSANWVLEGYPCCINSNTDVIPTVIRPIKMQVQTHWNFARFIQVHYMFILH